MPKLVGHDQSVKGQLAAEFCGRALVTACSKSTKSCITRQNSSEVMVLQFAVTFFGLYISTDFLVAEKFFSRSRAG